MRFCHLGGCFEGYFHGPGSPVYLVQKGQEGRTQCTQCARSAHAVQITPQGTTWASSPGKWELTLIEGSCFEEVGEDIDHKAFLSAIRNLLGRKAGKLQPFYHPLSSPSDPCMPNSHPGWRGEHDYPPRRFRPRLPPKDSGMHGMMLLRNGTCC